MENCVDAYSSLSISPPLFSAQCTSPMASTPRGLSVAIPRSFHSLSPRSGMIHVYSYTPSEGEQNVPITVHMNFFPKSTEPTYVRLVVGRKAVATQVNSLGHCWQLDAVAPPFDREHAGSTKVALTVQLVDGRNTVLESFTFGEFTYWESDAPPGPPRPPVSKRSRRSSSEDVKPEIPTSPRLAGNDALPTPPPSAHARPRQRKHPQRHIKPQALMRTKHASAGHVYARKAELQLLNPLEDVCCGWSTSERQAGRRLVRFYKELRGHLLRISCEPIRQDDYSTSDIVISCIHREDERQFFVTSVDIIYLLEKLVDSHFEVEEKNRIRRNLEGLKPITVSKNRPGFELFFQRIMDFQDPRPRNIEKDLKVFEWSLLPTALEKIISKYSLCSDVPLQSDEPPGDSTDQVYTHDVPPTFLADDASDPASSPCLSIDPQVPEYIRPGPVHKVEPLSEELSFLPLGSDGSAYYPPQMSPTDTVDIANGVHSPTNLDNWTCVQQLSDLDGAATYDVMAPAYSEEGYELATFEFQTLPEHHPHTDGANYYDGFHIPAL